jgi:hypothetical protein
MAIEVNLSGLAVKLVGWLSLMIRLQGGLLL